MDKKERIIIVFSIILVLSFSFISAGFFNSFWNKATGKAVSIESISQVLDNMVESSFSEEVFVVYGDNADSQDSFGAFMIAYIFPYIEGKSYVRKVSEIPNWQNKNLILVGGPCANKISEQITDLNGYNCKDWKFDAEESLVKVFNNGDGMVVLVAGTTLHDTWKISDAIRRYTKSEKMMSSDEVVFGTPIEDTECGNEICETGESDLTCSNDCVDESVQLASGLIVQRLNIYGDVIVFDAYPKEEAVTETDGMVTVGGVNYIYSYNLYSGQQTKISEGISPAIYGNYIVFIKRGGLGDLVFYNLDNGEMKVIHSAGEEFDSPLIHGDFVVYKAYDDGAEFSPVYKYNIKTGQKEEIFNIGTRGVLNDFYGNIIVYEDNGDIYFYDLASSLKKRITFSEERQAFPVVYENIIVWVDNRNIAEGKKEIYFYDLLTGEETLLDLNYNIGFGPGFSAIALSENKIIWTDWRNGDGGGDIYLYDLDKNIEVRITTNAGSLAGAGKISGNNIIWIDSREGIYYVIDSAGGTIAVNPQDLYFFKL